MPRKEAISPKEEEGIREAKDLVKKYEEAMEDDFNTADGISAVFELVKLSNSTADDNSSADYIHYLKRPLKHCVMFWVSSQRKDGCSGSGDRGYDKGTRAGKKREEFCPGG